MLYGMSLRSEHLYWVWLALKLNNQNTVFQQLLDGLGGSVGEIYGATEDVLRRFDFLTELQIESLLDKRLEKAMSIMDFCSRSNIGIICYTDPQYPSALRSMKNPPVILYFMGKMPDLNKKICVSVVGTRKMTEYGMRCCYKIAYELASAGAVVISGMALGIDSIAHAGAIGGRGETVAVLGCGIDVIYPKQHRKLRQYICEHGAVISAYHPGTPAYKHNFPERNAIISALSEGTLIVEAPKKSGALITAECATEQSRAVYALPGSVEEPMSEGPNDLIKDGAIAVTCARDILNYYFERGSKLVDPVKLRHGEMNSDFDKDILDAVGISASCHGKGSQGSPASMLKKLNEQLNDNEKINKDYYSVPKIKKIDGSAADESIALADKREKSVRTASEPSESTLASLSEKEREIFSELPCDKPVSVDTLAKNGHSVGTLMATLTMLEIKGLVSSLPGGMYIRK